MPLFRKGGACRLNILTEYAQSDVFRGLLGLYLGCTAVV